MLNRRHLACLILLSGILSASPAQSAIGLTFGVYASNKPTEMISRFRPVLDVMETELTQSLGEPVKIRLRVAHTYEDGRRQLVEGQVDFVRFGPASYVLAKEQQPAITILATESNAGSRFIQGLIAIPGDRDLTSLEQLKGKSFAFGNETSTIGRFLSPPKSLSVTNISAAMTMWG